MKAERAPLIVHLALAYGVIVFQAIPMAANTPVASVEEATHEPSRLKEEALVVLENKCNVCHKKQNPFKVFKESNMSKHAPKIYEQVFVKKRMPRPGQTLTDNERSTLSAWLQTEKIN